MLNNTIKGNASGATANPDDITITQVLDMVGSAAQGDILYRGASVWNRLAAGTSGQLLASQGAGANPHWITAIGTGNVVGPSSALDGCIPLWDTTTGQLLKDSALKLTTTTGVTRGADATTVRNAFVLGVADCAEFTQTSTAGHLYGTTLTVRRTADYSGTPTPTTWVNNGLNVLTTVNSGANGNEWAITGAVHSSGSGSNVGIYGQGWRNAGSGAMWGMVAEAQDFTGAQSTGALIGAEVDCFANGTNSNHNRNGVMVVAGRASTNTNNAEIWAGLYLTTTQSAGVATAYYTNGLFIGNDESIGLARATATNAIAVLADGTYGFWDRGSKTNGILLAGTYSGAAIDIGSNNIAMTGSLGSTGSRLTKGWFADLQVTNAINGSITGSAPTLTTPRAIYGNNFDGSLALTQIIASTYGGTGNGFTKFTGPTASEKAFILPNAADTIGCLGTVQTWSAAQTFNSGKLILAGATSGTTALNPGAAAAGTTTLNTATGTSPLTLSVQNSGDTNNSSSGSGSDYNHNLTYAIPANFLTAGRAIRVTAQFTFNTGSAAPSYTLKLKMGTATVASHTPVITANSLAGLTIAKTWTLQPTAAPGSAVNVYTGDCGAASTMSSSIVNFNNIAQPVALATNGSLTLQLASQWSATGTGTNTITLSQLIVEALN